jgi:hypothetical protein
MQEIDSERRIQILRGERPAPLAIEGVPSEHDPESRSSAGDPIEGRERKKRKRPHENDTDFELRIARDQVQKSSPHTLDPSSSLRRPTSSNAPLTDPSGHISLFPPASSSTALPPASKNPEAESEAARARKEYEDQYTLRFSNAAGFKQGLDKPWYSKAADKSSLGDEEVIGAGVQGVGKDVWGNEDPRRKQREAARVAANDPLAAMRQGAAQVRKVERERKKWQEERDREMVELLKAEQERRGRREMKRRRKGNDYVSVFGEDDGLEGFSLDKHESTTASRSRRHSEERKSGHQKSHRRSHYRERDRSRESHSDRHRRNHRH